MRIVMFPAGHDFATPAKILDRRVAGRLEEVP